MTLRRTGNEFVFQQLAIQNIENMNNLKVDKIITQCPHCFNTIANEYPQLGGNYQVIHHSQLLTELVQSGRIEVGTRTSLIKLPITIHAILEDITIYTPLPEKLSDLLAVLRLEK